MTAPANFRTEWPFPILAVAFDMDGLLLNTEQLYFEVFQTLLERRGKQFTANLRRGMMGLPGPQALALLIATECLTDTEDELQIESDEIFSVLLPHRLQTMPGLDALLSLLERQSIPRCVATSSRPWFAEHLLGSAGLLNRMDFVVTSSEVARGKPAPDIYLAAANRMRVHPNQMLVLEDSEHGCRAGVTSGACTVAVPGDHSRDHDFKGTFAIASSLADSLVLRLIAPGT